MRLMLQNIQLSDTAKQWGLPRPVFIQGYEPMQVIDTPPLITLHHKVFAVGALWDSSAEKNVLPLAMARKRRQWFEDL